MCWGCLIYDLLFYCAICYYQSVSHVIGEVSLYDSYFLLLVFSRTLSLFLIVYKVSIVVDTVLYLYALPIDHLLLF